MVVAHHIRDGIAPIVDLIYPPRCPLCGEAMAAQDGVCGACWKGLIIPGEPCCAKCQRPFESEHASSESICAPCLEKPPRHDGIAAATLYNDASRKLVLAFKHGGRIALGDMLGALIAGKVPVSDERYLIVPVPLHRWRIWRRGFNQSALLAQALEKRVDGELLLDALVRCEATPFLGGMGKTARRKILSGAIAVKNARRSMITGRHILLVDDVLTSGATSEACVRALKQAGAAKVTIACFARVLSELTPETEFPAQLQAGPQNETPEVNTPGAT